MQFMSPMEKSQSTLYSVSTKSTFSSSTASDSNTGDDDETDELTDGHLQHPHQHMHNGHLRCNGNGNRKAAISDRQIVLNLKSDSSFENDDNKSDVKHLSDDCDDNDSDLSYNECDITLMDDDLCDAKNEAELMFFQVVEILRYEQEVCF